MYTCYWACNFALVHFTITVLYSNLLVVAILNPHDTATLKDPFVSFNIATETDVTTSVNFCIRTSCFILLKIINACFGCGYCSQWLDYVQSPCQYLPALRECVKQRLWYMLVCWQAMCSPTCLILRNTCLIVYSLKSATNKQLTYINKNWPHVNLPWGRISADSPFRARL